MGQNFNAVANLKQTFICTNKIEKFFRRIFSKKKHPQILRVFTTILN